MAFVWLGLLLAIFGGWVAGRHRWRGRLQLPSARRHREAALCATRARGGAPSVASPQDGEPHLRRVRMVDREWARGELGAVLLLALILFIVGHTWAYVPGGLGLSAFVLLVWWVAGRDKRRQRRAAPFPPDVVRAPIATTRGRRVLRGRADGPRR